MIYAGTRPPDRSARARARAERGQPPPPVVVADGPPDVGQQRAWNQPLAGAIDIVITGTPFASVPPAEGQPDAESSVNL